MLQPSPTFINEDVLSQIQRLACSIYQLQRHLNRPWIPWTTVARYQEGSERLAEKLHALASLPEAASYFACNDRAVTLKKRGVILAQTTSNQSISSPTEKIAQTVKRYASRLEKLHFHIRSIQNIGQTEKRYVHAVEVELGDAIIPSDAPVTIVSKSWGTRVNGRIVGQDPEKELLYLALESRFWADQLPGYMLVDQAFLLYQLAESLGSLDGIPVRGQLLFKTDNTRGFPIAKDDSRDVAIMLANLSAPWTRFLWGPPGAGKTYCLARLMVQLLEQNPEEKILLVAPSNVAADVALSLFVEQLEKNDHNDLLAKRRILRYGYPRKSEILSRPELLGSVEQAAVSTEIAELAAKIQANTRQQAPAEEQLALMRASLIELQEQLKGLLVTHIRNCSVVVTTTTQAYMRTSPITHGRWDTVLVDEVTMVPAAVCLYLSSLAQKRLLFAGDPRQLGPVFQEGLDRDEDVRRWMGRDVYDFAQITLGSGEDRQVQEMDKRLVQITSQRRCVNDIWQPIKHLYKNVRVDVDESRIGWLRSLPPSDGYGITVVDVGKFVNGATCEKAHKSWQNPKAAELSVCIAEDVLTSSKTLGAAVSIAIITPYRAQYRLLKQLLKEREMHQVVEVGTIHQFQGSEADVVIFDMVDGPGRTTLGKLLKGDTGTRLVNVAISRARGKLIIIADKNWCYHAMKRTDNTILWDVVNKY